MNILPLLLTLVLVVATHTTAAPQTSSRFSVAALYERELGKAATSTLKMHTQSRHFIVYDDPRWLLTQIEAAIQEVV